MTNYLLLELNYSIREQNKYIIIKNNPHKEYPLKNHINVLQ